MAYTGKHVSVFSPDGKLFALLNEQGILRIWDTETNELKQEYTPNLHLSHPCTALTWLRVSSREEKKAKKARKLEKQKTGLYIALGTSNGKVSLYSYAEGKIERQFKGDGHSGKITGITQGDSGLLYTSGEDCQVLVWSVSEEKQENAWSIGTEKPNDIRYMHKSNTLVIGTRQLKLFSLETHEVIQTFTGHVSEVNLMCSFNVNDEEFVLTTSKMERIICLWKLGKKGKNKAAACTLLMEDIAYGLTCQAYSGTMLKAASVTRSGVIHIYHVELDSIKSEKPIKPKVTIKVASDNTDIVTPIPAISSNYQHIYSKNELLFCYGSNNCLVFEHIMPSEVEKVLVLIRSDPSKLYSKNITKDGTGTNNALKTLTPIINTDDVEYQLPTTIRAKHLKATELPMEARLKNLNLSQSTSDSVPNPQSKVQLLTQALQSKDKNLLRSVLCTRNVETIKMTLVKLPVQYIGPLVNELTLLLQKKHSNVEYSIIWMKNLAEIHAGQLMALGADNLLEKFSPYISTIEYRTSCIPELIKVGGRLQMLVNQIKNNYQNEENGLDMADAVIYEEDDSANSDLEGNLKTYSEREWSENGEDNENMSVDSNDAGDKSSNSDKNSKIDQDNSSDDEYSDKKEQSRSDDNDTDDDDDEDI